MKVFILNLFFVNIFYNFSLKRKNIFPIKLERKFLFIVFLFGLLVLFITCKFSSRSFLDFSLALASVLLLASIILSPGIRADGLNIFMGSTTLIKFAPFDKIKNFKLDSSSKNEIILSFQVFSSSHKLTFDSKHKNEIENLIRSFL